MTKQHQKLIMMAPYSLSIAVIIAAASTASIPGPVDQLSPGEDVPKFNVLQTTPALSPALNLPSGWSYTGCYVDNVSDRSLKGAFQSIDAQTGLQCVTYCSNLGFDIAATEWGRECFCDWQNNAAKASEADCDMPCDGDDSQVCGGSQRLSLYQGHAGVPVTNPGDGTTFQYVGCYSDSVEARLLPALPLAGPTVTVGLCIEACRDAGYVSQDLSFAFAGVEYGQECFCGLDSVWPDPVPGDEPGETGCNMVCKGNATEFCGGWNRMGVYIVGPLASPYPYPTDTGEPAVSETVSTYEVQSTSETASTTSDPSDSVVLNSETASISSPEPTASLVSTSSTVVPTYSAPSDSSSDEILTSSPLDVSSSTAFTNSTIATATSVSRQ